MRLSPVLAFNFEELAEIVFGPGHRAEQWKIIMRRLSAKVAYYGP